jgi:polar amino acid transport system substrate-binding protein
MSARVRLLAAAAAVLLVAAGCTSTGSLPPPEPARAQAPRPVGVQDPAVIPTGPPTAPGACDPRASLKPSGALPAPRRMPAGSTMARIVQRGRLIAGVDQNNFLLGFRDPKSGELTGFETDLVREIAKALFGRDRGTVQFRALSAAERIKALQDGSVDLVIRSFTMTCERWQEIAFSTEALHSGQRVLVNRDSQVKGLSQLGGQKVCAAAGSTSIRALAAARPAPVPVAAVNTLDCLVMLQQNQVAAVSTDDTILAGFAAQDPGTKVVGPAFTNEPQGVGIAKSATDLVRFVNGVLERMRADGTWVRLYNRWLAGALGGSVAPPPAVYRD